MIIKQLLRKIAPTRREVNRKPDASVKYIDPIGVQIFKEFIFQIQK